MNAARARAALALAVAGLAAGCASAPLERARHEFDRGRPARAAEALAPGAGAGDGLETLMERGMVLFAAGRHEESARALLAAAELSRDLETRSASRFAGSILTTERLEEYRGEAFERVLVHTLCALDFLALHRYEDALVECRRALRLLQEAKEPWEQHPFTRYLAALLFECLGEPDSACIEYRRVLELAPGLPWIKGDLLRAGALTASREDLTRWAELPGEGWAPFAEGEGEVVVFLLAGRSPVKVQRETFIPPSHRFVIPAYRRRHSPVAAAEVAAEGARTARTVTLTDLGHAAVKGLEKRIAAEVAKQTARLATKEGLAQVARHNDEPLLELALRVFFFLTEAADLRGWQTAPDTLQVARLRLPAGEHILRLRFLSGTGAQVGDQALEAVPVRPGRPTFLAVRAATGPAPAGAAPATPPSPAGPVPPG
ncbi:MAG: hypothetical protein HY722_17300 [Planctomycetes bacterium]|nr:hypothetical protein [Planctomycetota bacterium]